MAGAEFAKKAHRKLLKRLDKRFEGTPGVVKPAKDEKKTAKKAHVEVLAYVERGSFSYGACAECGWEGPGRRARDKATRDYLEHAVTCS